MGEPAIAVGVQVINGQGPGWLAGTGQVPAQADHGKNARGAFERLRQFTIGIGQRRQRFAGQAREMLAQHLRAVAVGLGKYDVDAHGQRLSGLNAVHQPGNQVARPGPLPVFDQALAVDANDDDRLVVP